MKKSTIEKILGAIIFIIVFIFVIALDSCIHKFRAEIESECKEKCINHIKRIFPSSEIIGYSINDDYYTYVVLDVNNIKEVDCTCNVYETKIEHIRIIGKNK